MFYYLNKDTVPTIPTPHDCKIKKVTIQGDYIIFEFEDDISYHDSIRHFNPDAKSLVIKIHLVDDFDIYKMKYIGDKVYLYDNRIVIEYRNSPVGIYLYSRAEYYEYAAARQVNTGEKDKPLAELLIRPAK